MKSSWIVRLVAVFTSFVLFTQVVAVGAAYSVEVALTKLREIQARSRHYTDRPGPIHYGKNPGRDAIKRGWWTDRTLYDLSRSRFSSRANAAHRPFASWSSVIGPILGAGLLTTWMQGGGGTGGGGDNGGKGGRGGGRRILFRNPGRCCTMMGETPHLARPLG